MRTVKPTQPDVPYNLNQAARVLQRSTATISYWLGKGELEEVPSHGRQRLISAASVRAKAQEIGVTIEPEAVSA